MFKPEWGTKRICLHCNAKFYDLKRQPIVCPKCETVFDTESLVKKRRGRPPASEAKPVPISPELGVVLDLELTEDMESLDVSDDVLEDTSDFGEDEEVPIEKVKDED